MAGRLRVSIRSFFSKRNAWVSVIGSSILDEPDGPVQLATGAQAVGDALEIAPVVRHPRPTPLRVERQSV